jgi:hypothetical protein
MSDKTVSKIITYLVVTVLKKFSVSWQKKVFVARQRAAPQQFPKILNNSRYVSLVHGERVNPDNESFIRFQAKHGPSCILILFLLGGCQIVINKEPSALDPGPQLPAALSTASLSMLF